MNIYYGKARIISNNEITSDVYLLSLELPHNIETLPGQFLEIKLDSDYQPFLRRPFSIFDQPETNIVKVLYKIRGFGTKILSEKKDMLDVILPLGRGVRDLHWQRYLLVAGGIGFAPLHYLAQFLIKEGKDVKFLIGTRNNEAIAYRNLIKNNKIAVSIITEDGSLSERGKVTDLLKKIDLSDMVIFSAGPLAMFKEINHMLKGQECFFFWESHFACGMGSCFGCIIETVQGLKRICFDGPLFKAKDIKWELI